MNNKEKHLLLSVFYGLFYYEHNCILVCRNRESEQYYKGAFILFLERYAPTMLDLLHVNTINKLVFKDISSLGTPVPETQPLVKLKFISSNRKSTLLSETKAESAILFYEPNSLNHSSKEELRYLKTVLMPILPPIAYKIYRGANEYEW